MVAWGNGDLWLMKRLPISVGVWFKTSAPDFLLCHPALSFISDLGYFIKRVFSLEKLPRTTHIILMSNLALFFPWHSLFHLGSPSKASQAWSASLFLLTSSNVQILILSLLLIVSEVNPCYTRLWGRLSRCLHPCVKSNFSSTCLFQR